MNKVKRTALKAGVLLVVSAGAFVVGQQLALRGIKQDVDYISDELFAREPAELQKFPHTDELKAALNPTNYDLQKTAFLTNNLMFVYPSDSEAREILFDGLATWSKSVIEKGDYMEVLVFLQWFNSAAGDLSGHARGEDGMIIYRQAMKTSEKIRTVAINAAAAELNDIRQKVLTEATQAEGGNDVNLDGRHMLNRTAIIEGASEVFGGEALGGAGTVSANLQGLLTATRAFDADDKLGVLFELDEYAYDDGIYTEVAHIIRSTAKEIAGEMVAGVNSEASIAGLEDMLDSVYATGAIANMSVLKGTQTAQAAAETSDKLSSDAWEVVNRRVDELCERHSRGKIDDSQLAGKAYEIIEAVTSYYSSEAAEQLVFRQIQDHLDGHQEAESMAELNDIAERVGGRMSLKDIESDMARLMVMHPASAEVQQSINMLLEKLGEYRETLRKAEHDQTFSKYQKWAFLVLQKSQKEIRNAGRREDDQKVRALQRLSYIDSSLLSAHMHMFYNDVMSEGMGGLDEDCRLKVYKYSLSATQKTLEDF